MLDYCLLATAFGPVGLVWNETGLVRSQLPGNDAAATAARLLRGLDDVTEADPPAWLADTALQLQRYFAGTPIDLSGSPLDLSGVPEFHRQLYIQMLKLGWGETVTYGELAERAGAPGAAQAVGRAMGLNPLPIIVPCHRVLGSNRKLGGFSAPGGTATKSKMLELEGVWLGSAPGQMAFGF